MGFISSIANAEHTFVSWFKTEVAKFEKAAPSVETSIENGVAWANGVLKIVLAQVDAGSPASTVIKKAIQDLLVLSAVSYDAGAHPTLATGFQDVITNLSGLETAVGIKNANTVATITKVISTLAAIVSALLAIVPAV
ncbi:MAG TPA: hypothetical protein VMQ76_02155 [Terracidiphilus sp.]|jgi:predicted anti-sigma-YlaC factor YlaD|nr:hypothetical protein [Terracidiphilus sp.]